MIINLNYFELKGHGGPQHGGGGGYNQPSFGGSGKLKSKLKVLINFNIF